MFDLILSWRRTTHVSVSYHGLSTLSTTETNVIGLTVQKKTMFDLILG
jgi:hypothetical protein